MKSENQGGRQLKQVFRILSTGVALGLLAVTFGVGPLFAGFTDTSGLGTLDASHAPAATVTVAEDKVEFAATSGADVSFVANDQQATFFILDGALQSTKAGTASIGVYKAGAAGAQQASGATTSIPTLKVAGAAVSSSVLVAAGYNTTSSASTPLTAVPTVTVDGVSQLVTSFNLETGVYAIYNQLATSTGSGAGTSTKMVASFNYHFQDSYDRGAAATRRAKVISTSDPAGEYVTIHEVADATSMATTTSELNSSIATTTLTVSVTNLPIVDATGDGLVNASDVAVVGSGGAKTVSSVDANSGVITLSAAFNSVTSSITYKHATASATSKFFRGNIALTSNAGAQGANNDGLWVQDGDTVTVSYLNSSGALIDSDTVKVDSVKPTISGISPADASVTNIINPIVSFDVTDTGSGISTSNVSTDVAITINGVAVNSALPSHQAIANGFRVTYATGNSWLTTYSITDSVKFTWQIVAKDVAGNTKTITGTDLEATIDQTKPDMTAAVTGTSYEGSPLAEKTGKNYAVKLTFSENLDSASIATTDFTVAGVNPTAVAVKDAAVYLTVAAQASDAKPEVKIVAAIADKAGNTLSTDTVTATDALKPGNTITIDKSLAIKADKIKTTVATDEKLAQSGLKVSVFGPSGAGGNGAQTVSSGSPTNYSSTHTAGGAATDTGIYGAAIQSTDLAANVSTNLTAVATESVVSSTVAGATSVITLAKGPLADANFDGALNGSDFTLVATSTGNASVTNANITAVDASARTLTVNANINTAKAATVSYSYVKTDVYEIDNSAPTVTFAPDGTSDVQDSSPFVRIIFDEDEYPGDTNKTVTVTAASVTKPDGTTDDILAALTSQDNKEFIWPASGLALGEHTIKVSAQDAGGNKLTDASVKIKIVERAKVAIALRPGWNLISLPGAPSVSAIGDVITVTAVDTVLTYDPTTAAKWLTAVRGTDGTFAGTLTTITNSQAYWVHTATFESIKVDIPGLAAGSAALPASYSLASGWNLIPVSIANAGDANPDADDYLSGLSWSRVYGYDNASNKFSGFDPAGSETLTVGKGYWIFLKAAGTLVP
jgi:hypothetical protein